MSVNAASGLGVWQLWAAQQQAQKNAAAQSADIASGGTTAATSTSADPGATSFMAELQGLMSQQLGTGAGTSASAIGQAGTVAAGATPWGPLPYGASGGGDGTAASASASGDSSKLASGLQAFIVQMQGASSGATAAGGSTSASASDMDPDGTSGAQPSPPHRHHHHHVSDARDSYASQSGTQSSDAVTSTTSVSA